MRYIFTAILIFSFIGVAVFGFTLFDHTMSSSDSNCGISTIDGRACPTSAVSMALHHISTLQKFSEALIPSIISLLFLALILLAISFFFLRKDLLPFQSHFLFYKHRDSLKSYSRQKITSWLALFELSPSLI